MHNTVSVIIPVYNVETYLERCLKSVIDQTYKELEIIIINDGSTDGSEKICRKWENLDNRITLINKRNEGLGPARNLGIKRAKGEYVAFIDSDDWWEKDAVEKLMEAATGNAADIVYMNFFFSEWDDISGEIVEREFVQYCMFEGVTSIDEMPELLFQPDARMWSKLFCRSLFTNNNIYMPAHPYEDFPVMPLLLLKAKRICQVHKPLYHYLYKRSGNLTGNRENHRYIVCGIEELYQKFEEEGYLKKYGGRLSNYVFKLAKETIDQAFIDYTDRGQYWFFAEPFWATLDKYCSEKVLLKDKKVFLVGSKSGELICKSFVFEEQIVGQCKFHLEEIQHNDIERMAQADYIFVDFLVGSSKAYNRKYVEDQCSRWFEIIQQKGLIEKVVLLKLFYAEEYGIHRDICRPYENIDEIKKANRFLEIYYEQFEADTCEKMKAVVDSEGVPDYTYEHTKAGCYPWYHHGNFYTYVGEKIRKRLTDYE